MGPTPGLDEVIVKRAALVNMQKEMAALVRGEDLPASQPGGQRGSRCALCSHIISVVAHFVYK